MTEREAVEIIKQVPLYRYECELEKHRQSDLFNALHTAIEALEKQNTLLDFLVSIEISNICEDDRMCEWCEEHCTYACAQKECYLKYAEIERGVHKMKFPTMEEMAKNVAEKAFDEYTYEGKIIRQWVETLKDYDSKQTTLKKIAERLEENKAEAENQWQKFDSAIDYGQMVAYREAIEIVKEVANE